MRTIDATLVLLMMALMVMSEWMTRRGRMPRERAWQPFGHQDRSRRDRRSFGDPYVYRTRGGRL